MSIQAWGFRVERAGRGSRIHADTVAKVGLYLGRSEIHGCQVVGQGVTVIWGAEPIGRRAESIVGDQSPRRRVGALRGIAGWFGGIVAQTPRLRG